MNATTANVVSVSVSSPAEGSTATHQESIVKQTFALKVQFNDDIRRFNLTELSFEPLVKRVAEVFKIPEAKLLLKYQDEEGDLVTVTSTDDLFDAQRLAAQRSSMLRLTASCNRKKKADDANIVLAPNAQPVSQAAVPVLSSPIIEYREQKKALKAQKKILKEEKKRLQKSGSPSDYKEQKKLLKEEKKELKSGKEELKAIKREAKLVQRSAREAIRENWRNMSPEDKIAIRKARQEARQEARGHAGCDGKAWKDMSREERIATRLARREARMAEGGHRQACRNKIVGRFVKHVTIPDGTTFEPRQPFTKTWRMRNEGAEPWTDCKLIFVSRKNGDLMGAPEEVVIPSPVAPGSEVDVSVQMVAPEQPGRYVGFWRLSAADGRKFGQRIWVKIDVVVSSSSSCDEKEKDNEAALSQSGGFKQMEDEIEESFIDIKEEKEEEEPVPSKPTIAELLKQLKALGFTDVGRNIPLLKKHNGDINKVIADLLA